MIDSFATRISTRLVEKFPDELPPLGITRYGIKFLISNVVPVVLLLIIGLMLNIVSEVVICLISFSSLRMVSGGYHAKKPEACLVISTILIALIAKFGYLLSDYTLLMNSLSLVLVAIFAPSNIENQTKILKEHFKYLKAISIGMIIMSFLLNNFLISAALLVQSLLLIRLKGGEKNDQNKND
ncbi:accessory gene regulator B family protein [Paenibacillus sp. FSL K6-1122]|uniref:accessory gene regulator ArgB-like protein n=1 Tax=Paenibacillus sp. FSL K6-1122 TaxID=2954512 RepID=UPI0030EEA398